MAGDETFQLTRGIVSFLGAPHVSPSELRARGSRAAFLGWPCEAGNQAVQRPGSGGGPQALRLATAMELPWSHDWDVDLFEAYDLVDCGDAPLVVGDLRATHRNVQAAIEEILAAGAIPITIGGDHSLAIPGARALSAHLGPDKRMGYIQIDAHMDMSPDIAGFPDSNCSNAVRTSELPNVAAENMAIVGVRGTINVREWWEEAERRGIRIYPMREVRERGVEEVMAEALDRVHDGTDGVYVTFDTDSIDSAFAPGTTGPEPAGFTSTEIIRVGAMIGERGLTAVDNVELCDVYDTGQTTAKLVWAVLAEMLYAHAHHHMRG